MTTRDCAVLISDHEVRGDEGVPEMRTTGVDREEALKEKAVPEMTQ